MSNEERDQVLHYVAERLANIEAILRVIGRVGHEGDRDKFLKEVEKAKTENIPPLAPTLSPSRHHD